MPNYKPYSTNAISIGGYIRPIRSGETPLTLFVENNPTTIGQSLHDAPASNYQVPSGKKFIILAVNILQSTLLKFLTLEQSDDADSSTNGVAKFVMLTTATVRERWIAVINEPSVASSKYLNVKIDNAATPSNVLYVHGVEVAN